MERLAFTLGRVVSVVVALVLAAVLVLLAAGIVLNAARTAYWLTQELPVVAVALAAVGVVLVGRKL